jgi:hypothetical protein
MKKKMLEIIRESPSNISAEDIDDIMVAIVGRSTFNVPDLFRQALERAFSFYPSAFPEDRLDEAESQILKSESPEAEGCKTAMFRIIALEKPAVFRVTVSYSDHSELFTASAILRGGHNGEEPHSVSTEATTPLSALKALYNLLVGMVCPTCGSVHVTGGAR